MKKRIILFLIRVLFWKIVLLWCQSLRVKKNHNEKFDELRKENKKFVLAFWHGSMLVGWFLHRPGKNEKVSALVSKSNDGEYLSTMMERWGFTMIRGSSHIGGKEAMQLMVDEVNSGSSICITPDGPRGPRHEMKMGAVRLAQKTQTPLVLVGIAMKKRKLLNSWDKFEVPMPYSKVEICYSEPIMVPEVLNGESLDEFKMQMQNRLNVLQAEAEML